MQLLDNKRNLLIIFALLTALIFVSFLVVSFNAGQGNLLMPLDDVYIHFQYARQLATGQPYVYNTGQAATSGATSFLYPYLLAAGYLIGFQDLWLGLWAMLIGAVALLASLWAMYQLCQQIEIPRHFALLMTLSFALTTAWHFMSGMETGVMIALTLWTLLLFIQKRLRGFVIVAMLLSLTRPEGGILAGIAVILLVARLWHETTQRGRLVFLAVPILAVGVQPMMNYLLTGSTVATGNQAKSLLALVPHDWSLIIQRILENVFRIWTEFIIGNGAEGWYLPPFIGLLALIGIGILLTKQNWRLVGLLLLGWLLAITGAVATLDTAFWHFKRYQMPVMAFFFPLALWTLATLRKQRITKLVDDTYGLLLVPFFAAILLLQFLNYHALNVSYVYQQPYQMSQWLRENTESDAVVGVHDVGMMRYLGNRATLDIVGLTTPNAASYWRNGPGSVAEFLLKHQPDYIANYGRGHGYGLAYLADTSIYGEPLVEFAIDDWQRQFNVALAADTQAIYQPNWSGIHTEAESCQHSAYSTSDAEPLLMINVADVQSELASDYEWSSDAIIGFPTEVQEFNGITGAYRLINQSESFTLDIADNSQGLVLITQVHAASAGTLAIYVDDVRIATRVIPAMRGNWLHLSTLIEPRYIHDNMRVRIEPHISDGYYMPACHVIVPYVENTTGEGYPFPENRVVLSSFAEYQDGAFALVDVKWQQVDNQLIGDFTWNTVGHPHGDYRMFVHLYEDTNQPPFAQSDGYLLDELPTGNWLLGGLSATITINLDNVPTGTYPVAIGFYNPNNPTDRLLPTSTVYDVSPDGRLWLGDIEVNNE